MVPVEDASVASAILEKVNNFNLATTAKIAPAVTLFALSAYLQ